MTTTRSGFARLQFLLLLVSLAFMLTPASRTTYGAEDETKSPPAAGEPLKLETSAYYKEGNENQRSKIKAFQGLQVIDSLQFQITGRVPLYGQSEASRGRNHAEAAKGISVGRCFDELHLVHFTYLPDVEGDSVASISLNYADGSAYSFPIRYGVHIRDWYNLPSYEKEKVSDPDTMICWRHAPYQFKAPVRIFKTKVLNPLPAKQVKSIDVISAKNLASYVLLGATVVDAKELVKPEFVGDRVFDNQIAVEVVDDVTGQPIEGALVDPSMYVLEEGVVGTPVRTNAKGMGVIPYSTKDTSQLFLRITKTGFEPVAHSWQTTIAKQQTIRLKATE